MADRISKQAARLAAMFGRVPSAVERRAVLAFDDIGRGQVREQLLRMSGDAAPGRSVRWRSGRLGASFSYYVDARGGTIRMRAFSSGVPYANIQEFGGEVRPKNGRYLTIPMPGILSPSGVVKGKYSGGAGAFRDDPTTKTFVWKSPRSGKLFIVEPIEKGKDKGKLRFLWRLVDKVTLQPRLGWVRTWHDLDSKRTAILDKAFGSGLWRRG